jgi:hypothetical protein
MFIVPGSTNSMLEKALMFMGSCEYNIPCTYTEESQDLVCNIKNEDAGNTYWCTWKAKDSEFFTLFKTTSMHTVFYSHTLKKCFFANNNTLIPNNCAPGTVVLGQYVEDNGPNGEAIPRILVFDMLRCNNQAGPQSLRGVSPMDRYMLLRDTIGTECGEDQISVQWAGEYRSCKSAICSGSMNCPHSISGIIVMDELDPCKIQIIAV